jgi:hypothetical protein
MSGDLYVKRVSCAQVMQFDLYGKLLLTLGEKFKPTEFCKPTQVLPDPEYRRREKEGNTLWCILH